MILERVNGRLEHFGYGAQSVVDRAVAEDDPWPGDAEQVLEGGLIVPGADGVKGRAIEQAAEHHGHQVCGVGGGNADNIVLTQIHRLQLLGDAYGKADGLAICQCSALRVADLYFKYFSLLVFPLHMRNNSY